MLQHLTLEEFLTLAKTAKRVAIFKEISADMITPISIFESLGDKMQHGAMLESGLHGSESGRHSFLSFDPIAKFQFKNGISHKKIGSEISEFKHGNPFTLLRQLISELNYVTRSDISNRINSAVGFIAYDAVRIFESIPDKHTPDETLPDILFNFYRTTLTFDHQQQKLLISVLVETNNNLEEIYVKALEEINQIIMLINKNRNHHSPEKAAEKLIGSIEADIDDIKFMRLVERAKEYIVNGDAFQIVLSRCFKRNYTASPFEIYRALRHVSPAPYMFYLPVENNIIIGASPERMISIQNNHITINPIAGSRRRTQEKSDHDITAELLTDKKELAEHMMLVDLARNDIGAVSEPGSIKINELLQVKHFSHISHITSTITGKLRKEFDVFDALSATFPAGTLSGAPKIRAMQIIDELETSRRGLYGGAICCFDYQSNLESCIAIRMAYLKDGVAFIRTGAGIVYDSIPYDEAQETKQKAQGLLDAIALAEGNLL